MHRMFVVLLACVCVTTLTYCNPEGSAAGVGTEQVTANLGGDGGHIYNEEDAFDAGADIDPDLLKSHQTCALMMQCASELCKSKATPDCDVQCIEDGSKSAVAAYKPYGDCRREVCAIGQCGGSGDPVCVNNCVLQKCSTLLFRCNAEGKSASNKCAAMVGCHKKCSDAAKARKKEGKGSQEFVCLNSCYAGMAAKGQDRYDAWASCYSHSKAKDPYADCLVELLTCGASGGHGEGNCGSLAGCIRGCEKQTGKAHDFQSCIGICYGAASESAQTTWQEIVGCTSDLAEGAVDAAKCGGALVSCGAPQGDLGCKAIATCTDTCHTAGKDNACAMTCLAQGSAAGASAYGDILWCSMVHCDKSCKGKAPCLASCQADKCKEQLAACID